MRDSTSEPIPNQPRLTFTSPPAHSIFFISPEAVWPSLCFEIKDDVRGELLTWNWRLDWNSYSKSGTTQTIANWWDAQGVISGCGGLLTVNVSGSHGTATTTVNICGLNPSAAAIAAYLNTKPDSAVFGMILQRESQMQHFDPSGHPKKSHDNGYGLCQLTHPTPSFEQCWSWQHNLDCGWALFQEKQREATVYLSQEGRSFSAKQLQYETVARWNGGKYHVWNSALKAWTRNPAVLCDTRTGNIGWNTANPANTGKSETELHERDSSCYNRLPTAADNWNYFGICYADQLLQN